MAAKGHMTDEELDEELAELDETRLMAEEELAALRGRKEILEELGRDRDALLESYAQMTPEALDALAPEERRQVYAMLRLKVVVYADGRMEARGVLSEDVCKLHENGHANEDESLCENGLVSQCAAPSGLRLSARRHAAFYSWRMGDRHRLGTPVDRPKLS